MHLTLQELAVIVSRHRRSLKTLNELGVKKAYGMASFLDDDLSYLISNPKANDPKIKHYKHGLNVLDSQFQSFESKQNGSMDDSQIEKAIKSVYQAMTLQEREIYQNSEGAP